MADPWHHSLSSARKWGGDPADYWPLHYWMDSSKAIMCDFRHRMLRHHAEGIDEMIWRFGPTITNSAGRQIPTRWIGEQHVKEDFGHIPSFVDWARAIKVEPWMNRVPKLDISLEPSDAKGPCESIRHTGEQEARPERPTIIRDPGQQGDARP